MRQSFALGQQLRLLTREPSTLHIVFKQACYQYVARGDRRRTSSRLISRKTEGQRSLQLREGGGGGGGVRHDCSAVATYMMDETMLMVT